MKWKHAVAPLIVLALIASFWLGRRLSEPAVVAAESDVVGPGDPGVASAVGGAARLASASEVTAARALASAAAKASSVSSASPTQVSPPLPPLDAPLASTLDSLRQHAAAGDARAACRIAAELRKCEMVDVQLAFAQRMERGRQQMASAPARGAPEDNARQGSMAPFVDAQYRDALAASEHCAGVPQTSPSEQIRYWRQAALQGHLHSMAMYASGNVFRMRNTLSNLKDFEVYRREAEPLARRAALAGDSEALLALTRAYAPQHDQMVPSLLAQATGADVVEELSMLLLAQKRGVSFANQRGRGPMFATNERSLEAIIADARGRADAEQVSRAEQLAASRDAQHAMRQTSAPAAIASERTMFDDERARCDSEAFAPVAPSPASG